MRGERAFDAEPQQAHAGEGEEEAQGSSFTAPLDNTKAVNGNGGGMMPSAATL